jgi:virginiamycin B lyase
MEGRRSKLAAASLVAALTILCASSADAFIYWADRDSGTIARAKSNGKGVDERYIKARASVYGVAVDDDHVYWTDRKGGAIGRANRDGSGVKRKLARGLSSPHGLAVDDGYLYWANSGTDSIGRAAIDGSDVNPNFITDAKGAGDVSVDAQHVYWTNSSGIGRANLDGTGVDQGFVATQAYGVDVNASNIFWAFFGYSPTRGGVGRSKLNGSGVEQKFVAARNLFPHGVAVDDAHIWWVESGGIGRSALSGKNAKPEFIKGPHVGHGESGIADMAVDADGTPPETAIKRHPPARSGGRSVRYRFESSEPESTFVCKLDKHGWKHCGADYEIKELDPGDHKLRVRATDQFGNTDPTPASDHFRLAG